jgi:hypothetical protein
MEGQQHTCRFALWVNSGTGFVDAEYFPFPNFNMTQIVDFGSAKIIILVVDSSEKNSSI